MNDNVALVNGAYVTPDPRFSTINHYRNLGWTRYKALQTQLRYRKSATHVGLSYTLGEVDLELRDHHHWRCRDQPARLERGRRAR